MKNKAAHYCSKLGLPEVNWRTIISFLSFFSLVLFPHVSTFEQFKVTVDQPKITALIGSDAKLTFYLYPAIDAEGMEIGFSRRTSTSDVHMYRKGRDEYSNQMKEYQGRTHLDKNRITNGEISLIITNVTPSDEGEYLCYFLSNNYRSYEVLDLTITAWGLDPLINIRLNAKEGLTAECESDGWYPEPDIIWTDSNGNTLMSFNENKETNVKGLYGVRSSIYLSPESAVTCSVWNILLNEGKEQTISLSDAIYNRVHYCAASRIVYPISIIILYILLFIGVKSLERIIIKKDKEKYIKRLNELKPYNTDLLKHCLQAEKAFLRFCSENTLNGVLVSEDGKKVTARSNGPKDVTDGSRGYILPETLLNGKCYWEFKINGADCSVGITEKSVLNGHAMNDNSYKEKTAVKLSELTKKETVDKFRVYLDSYNGTLTIFRLDNMEHISKEFNYEEACLYFEVGNGGEVVICDPETVYYTYDIICIYPKTFRGSRPTPSHCGELSSVKVSLNGFHLSEPGSRLAPHCGELSSVKVSLNGFHLYQPGSRLALSHWGELFSVKVSFNGFALYQPGSRPTPSHCGELSSVKVSLNGFHLYKPGSMLAPHCGELSSVNVSFNEFHLYQPGSRLALSHWCGLFSVKVSINGFHLYQPGSRLAPHCGELYSVKVSFNGFRQELTRLSSIISNMNVEAVCNAQKQSLPKANFGAVFILFLILFIFPHVSESVPFNVMVSSPEVTAIVGSDTKLTFYLSPELNAERMEISINRQISPHFYVHLYRNERDENEGQMAEYHGRTRLDKESIRTGRISLIISNIVPWDEGDYQCSFTSHDFHNYAILYVRVAALGLNPFIKIKDYLNEAITAECESDGWYPEPEIMWRDTFGNTLQSFKEQKHSNEKGLFKVQSSVDISSNMTVSCSIRNILLNEGREPSIYMSESLYTRVDRCGVSRYLILCTSAIIFAPLFVYIAFTCITVNKIKEKHQKDIEDKRMQLETSKKEYDILIACLQARKVSVSLDPETAHPNIIVSENGKQAMRGLKKQNVIESSKRFDSGCYVLGKEMFSTGKVYWELLVENYICAVGIAKKSVLRKNIRKISSANGIFALRLWESNILNNISNETNSKLTMYLDYDGRQLVMIAKDNMEYERIHFECKEEVLLFLEVFSECEIAIL
ncbi:uncharacterized protein O3C94_011864 [Discoglossus pictus]